MLFQCMYSISTSTCTCKWDNSQKNDLYETRWTTVTTGRSLWHRHSLGLQLWEAAAVQVGKELTANAQLLPVSAATEIDTSLSGSQEGREGARQTILMQSGTPGAVTMRRADPFTVCNIKGTSGSPIFWLIISVDCCKEASDAMSFLATVISQHDLEHWSWYGGKKMVSITEWWRGRRRRMPRCPSLSPSGGASASRQHLFQRGV